jgi:GT2 family glycosyltransferase
MIPAMVVPVLTRPDLLHRMLDSIDYPVSDLVIIDNGHVAPGRQVVENVQRTHVVTMPCNLGVPASWNLGVKCLPHATWWLIVNSDAWFPAGSLERLAAVQSGGVVLSAASPPWACFALHDEAVQQVGLFDEGLYPAYFEDCDYERRCRAAGVPVVQTDIEVHHDNSSTIASIPNRNGETFAANERHYRRKVETQDFTEGHWSLATRRANSWD